MGVIKRQGIKNTVISFVGIGIGLVSQMFIQPQLLSMEEFGLTKILLNFSILIAMVVPMGIGNVTVRFFPLFKNKEKQDHGYFGFMMLFPLLGFALASLFLYVFKDFIAGQWRRESPLFSEYFNWVYPLILFNSFIAIFTTYCSVNFKTTIPSFINDILVRLLTVGVVVCYFLKYINLNQFIGCFVFIYGVQMILLLSYIYFFDKPGYRINWEIISAKRIFELLRYGMLFWLASIASIGLKTFDSIIVSKFMPLKFVAIYAVAALMPTIIDVPVYAFDKIAASKISFAWTENDRDQIKKIYQKSSLALFLLGGLLYLLVVTNTHTLLSLLRTGYQSGEPVVYIISIASLFNMATGLNVAVLINSPKYRYGAAFLIFLALFLVCLQFLFVPRWGIVGAAFATCIALLVYNSLGVLSVWRFYHIQPFERSSLKVLMTILICGGIAWFMPHFKNFIIDFILRTCAVTIPYALLVYYFDVGRELFEQIPFFGKLLTRKSIN